MFIITKYILREHVGPFIFAMTTIVMLFLLNVLFRDLGRFLGKGLPAGIIVEFFAMNLAWILTASIPMSVLAATVMAFGRLSADSEIAAMKASGIHFYRMIAPVFVVSVIITVGMERFQNLILPDCNHRVRVLYGTISRKRPTLALEPNVFFDDIPHYSMIVREIDEDGHRVKGIVISDQGDSRFNKTIIADSGYVEFSTAQERMIFTLFNGEWHEVELKDFKNYRRGRFEEQVISMSVPNMTLKRNLKRSRNDREKSVKMMRQDIEKNLNQIVEKEKQIVNFVDFELSHLFTDGLWNLDQGEDQRPRDTGLAAGGRERLRIERLQQQIESTMRIIRQYERSNNRLLVEIQKKYSISVACIVFVFVGAPLGIMARQGGMAVGAGFGLVFYLVYWTFLIGGEELADRSIVGPATAMWAPNILVGLLGCYLVIKTVKETTFIQWDRWLWWLRRRGRGRQLR